MIAGPLHRWVDVAESVGGCNIYVPHEDGISLYSQDGTVVHIVIGEGTILEVSLTRAGGSRTFQAPIDLQAALEVTP